MPARRKKARIVGPLHRVHLDPDLQPPDDKPLPGWLWPAVAVLGFIFVLLALITTVQWLLPR